MTFNFDMDGTIADFYGAPEWLEALNEQNTAPYEQANPLLNFRALAQALHAVQRRGHRIVIISWGSKRATPDFLNDIETAKRDWLIRHLPSVVWDEIFVVPYGTPKQTLSDGILFDDEEPNREAWGEGAHTPDEILEVLRSFYKERA